MWLNVAMDHAALVSVLQAARRLPDCIARLRDGQSAALGHNAGEVGPLHKLHDEKVCIAGLLGVVGGDYVRMGEAGGRLHLTAETLDHRRIAGKGFADDLNGNGASHQLVFGLENGPMPPLPRKSSTR